MTSYTLPHELHGDGPHKVFAVHGWFTDRSAYAGVLPDLDRTEFTYALVDLRGYGGGKHAVGADTTAEAALDLVELADQLGWERFSVVGHSMGGAVGQRLLAVAPHRLRRLVGVSPVPASALALPPEMGVPRSSEVESGGGSCSRTRRTSRRTGAPSSTPPRVAAARPPGSTIW
ncbi:alpha/beta fold hydrolase [Streptomyces sp. CA-251387]|uniref:alpha/beta fold hydrolase n=1 Tax=Streptomyces sp. CA-251387 TaxID=3240064 RepID=UPI003D8EBF3C